jgi:hypothetical protein
MEIGSLKKALEEIKKMYETAISTATFDGKSYRNGVEAKTALIRSEQLIQKIHEEVKISLNDKLKAEDLSGYQIHPPIGKPSPELDVWGFLKKKKQDIVILFSDPVSEKITEGPLIDKIDKLGKATTEKSIVIGVRSQLSSIDKNFDTLMERAFAEAMNLHFRHPRLVVGEVYLLIVKEYDDQAMKENEVAFKDKYTNVEKFISIFNGISHRECNECTDPHSFYKYEATALLLVDFSQNPVKLYTTIEELKEDGIVRKDFNEDYSLISPIGFTDRIIKSYKHRHGIE